MNKSLRLKILLATVVVAFCGVVSSAGAKEQSPPTSFPQSTSSINFQTTEEVSKFLQENSDKLTPYQADLLEKAVWYRAQQEGQTSFLFMPATNQLAFITEGVNNLLLSLWPHEDPDTKAYSPGILGFFSDWTDAMLSTPKTITAGQMLASLNPTKSIAAQAPAGVIDFQDLPRGTNLLDSFGGLVLSTYWTSTRNLALAILTGVLVLFGFMIMLRKDIEPRTAMTISNSLPRIALALVLITFSFAISGLIIDIGRVADGLFKRYDIVGFAPAIGNTQSDNHYLTGIIEKFAKAGLSNIGANFNLISYLFKLPQETLDRHSPKWRCDYNRDCPENVNPRVPPGNNHECKYRKGYGSAGNPTGTWTPCPPFYCYLGPFNTFPVIGCRLSFRMKNPLHAPPLLGGPEYIFIGLPLIPDAEYPGWRPGDPQSSIPCGDPPSKKEEDRPGYPDWQNEFSKLYHCCNPVNTCRTDPDIRWQSPFPRDTGNIIELGLNRIIAVLIGAFINLFFFITLLQTVFTLFFRMMGCFARWFLYTIFSPLVFMWGAVPGQENTIADWVKNFLANVLAFPVVNFLLNLALAFANYFTTVVAPAGGNIRYPSILYIGNTAAVGMFIPFGILILTPMVPKALQDIFATKKSGEPPDLSKQLSKMPIVGGMAR